jgi:hypothetical protein
MPEGAVYVGRPTQYGNPFTVKDTTQHEAVCLFRWLVECNYGALGNAGYGWTAGAWYTNFPEPLRRRRIACWVRDGLRGKDLACWCPLDQPCHADVLLELANTNG